jgi:hypothetical protein
MRALPVRDVGVTVNYPMEICADSPVGHTAYNGATRQIPGTSGFCPHNGKPIPDLEEEPLWMKMSTTSPAPAGTLYAFDFPPASTACPSLASFSLSVSLLLSVLLSTTLN